MGKEAYHKLQRVGLQTITAMEGKLCRGPPPQAARRKYPDLEGKYIVKWMPNLPEMFWNGLRIEQTSCYNKVFSYSKRYEVSSRATGKVILNVRMDGKNGPILLKSLIPRNVPQYTDPKGHPDGLPISEMLWQPREMTIGQPGSGTLWKSPISGSSSFT